MPAGWLLSIAEGHLAKYSHIVFCPALTVDRHIFPSAALRNYTGKETKGFLLPHMGSSAPICFHLQEAGERYLLKSASHIGYRRTNEGLLVTQNGQKHTFNGEPARILDSLLEVMPDDALALEKDDLPVFFYNVYRPLADLLQITGFPAELEAQRFRLVLTQTASGRLEVRLFWKEQPVLFSPLQPNRDLPVELRIRAALSRYFKRSDPVLGCLFEEDPAAVMRFLHEGLPGLAPLGDIDNRANPVEPLPVPLSLSLDGEQSHLLLVVSCPLPIHQALRLLENKTEYTVHNGRSYYLPSAPLLELRRFIQAVKRFLTPVEEGFRAELAVSFYLRHVLDGYPLLKPEQEDWNIFERPADDAIPPELERVLFDYQKEGFLWLRRMTRFRLGGILADDMGLGKTLQILALVHEAESELPSLVLCPATLVDNWKAEAEKFFQDLPLLCVRGSRVQREKLYEQCGSVRLVVLSYDTLRQDIDILEKLRFYLCIADEAQAVKNFRTRSSQSIRRLQSVCRFAVTGTSIENNLSELWGVFSFVSPGLLGSYEWYKETFADPIEQAHSKHKEILLRQTVSPFILRRLKSDELKGLPDKAEREILVTLGDIQQAAYDERENKLIRFLKTADDEEFEQKRLEIVSALLLRMRQICCHPPLFLPGYCGESAKLEACLALVGQLAAEGHRILLFSQFTAMLGVLSVQLRRQGIPFYQMTGETPMKERLELVRSFNEADTPVFLISLKVGGAGLNLVGADTVIHYDPWWNPSVQNQASDRLYRIGQTKDVTVYHLICRGTIEQRIRTLQQQKQELSDSIIAKNNGSSILRMSREELLALLEPEERET